MYFFNRVLKEAEPLRKHARFKDDSEPRPLDSDPYAHVPLSAQEQITVTLCLSRLPQPNEPRLLLRSYNKTKGLKIRDIC